MADGNKDSRRRFGRRGRGRSGVRDVGAQPAAAGGQDAQVRAPSPAIDQPAIVCPICQKQIFDLASALANRDGGQPVHFDCALAQLAETERLETDEHIAYIGHGSFAVVSYRDKSMTAFTIKRRIPWEKEGEKFDWRRTIQQRLGL